MPKVSVIVPIYKVEKYIERCVRSLFEQTLDDIEYIFVNDCTPDKSVQLLHTILENYPKRQRQVVILNHSVNTGQSGARRDGMKVATGDFIIHCDADDWVDLDMYEKMYKKAIETNADAVCCDMVMEFAESQKYLQYDNCFSDHQLMYDCIAPISVEYCSMCNRLISRKVYDKYSIDPFVGVNMWDDVGLSIRFRYYIQNCVVINRAFYHYNRQNENSTTRRPVLGRIQEQIECAKQLEAFFISEGALSLYSRFISLVKLVAKDDLFHIDMDLWRKTFPETRNYLQLLMIQNSNKRVLLKLKIVAYWGSMGIEFIKLGQELKKKNHFLRLFRSNIVL